MRFLRLSLLTLAAVGLMLSVTAQPAEAATPRPNQQQQVDNQTRGEDTQGQNIDPITGKPAGESSVIDYVNSAYQFAAVVGGLLAVLMLIYAGYRYMTSYGDPENIKDAKDIVEKALIGLALLILAALILNTINPRTAQDPCKPKYNGQGENVSGECGDIDFSDPNGSARQNNQGNNNNNGNNNQGQGGQDNQRGN